MLNARSKEPFAMESLDSEVQYSDSVSLEFEAQSRQSNEWSANDNDSERNSQDTNSIQNSQSKYAQRQRNGNQLSTAPAPDGRFNVNEEQQYSESTLWNQGSTERTVDDGENVQASYRNSRDQESQQVDLGFRANTNPQRYEEADRFQREDSPQQINPWAPGTSPSQNTSLPSSSVSGPLEASAGGKSPTRRNRKKKGVSAETKARWAMLRSLAGTEDDGEDQVLESGSGKEQVSRGVDAQSMSFKASVQEELSSTRSRQGSTNGSLAQSRRQIPSRKVESQVNTKQFALTSKAAIESDLRRSESGRQQSSRGEHGDSESSMSRAASVRRYMEKLRGDPHIDEKHLASLPPVEELETHQARDALGNNRDMSRDVRLSGDLSRNLDEGLDGKGRQIEAMAGRDARNFHQDGRRIKQVADREEHNFGRDTRDLHQDGQRIKQDAKREEHNFGQHFGNEAQELNATARREERDVSRDAQSAEGDIRKVGQGLVRGAQTLSHIVGRDSRALSEDVGRDTRGLEASVMDGHQFEIEANQVGAALGADRKELTRDAEQLEATLDRKEHRLEHDVGAIAGALGLGEVKQKLDRDERALARDAHQTENALGLGQVEQVLGKGAQELQHEANNLDGSLMREAHRLEHDAHEVGALLGIGGIAAALSQEGRNLEQDVHKTEAALQSDGHMLGGLMSEAAGRTDRAFGHLEGHAERGLEHEGQNIRGALGGFERALASPDMQQRNGAHPAQSMAFQGANVPPSKAFHQQPNQMPQAEPHHGRDLPHSQQLSDSPGRSPPSQNVPIEQQRPLQQKSPHMPNMPMAHQQSVPANSKQASGKPPSSSPHEQMGQPQQSSIRSQASQPQRTLSGTIAPPYQQALPRQGPQPQQNAPHIQHTPLSAKQQQAQAQQQAPTQKQLPPHQQIPAASKPPPQQQASLHGQGPNQHQQVAPTHPVLPSYQSVPPVHAALAATGAASICQKPQQLQQPQGSSVQAPLWNQNHQQQPLAPGMGNPPGAGLHPASTSPNNSGLNKPSQMSLEQSRAVIPSQGRQLHTPHLPQIGIPSATARKEGTGMDSCRDEGHIRAGTCRKDVPCMMQNPECKDPAHLASGMCLKGASCKQKAKGCENVQHLRAGLCIVGQPCVQRNQQVSCEDSTHHGAGLCSRGSPCTQKGQTNCQDARHHAAGTCSKEAPCTQTSQHRTCQNAGHHAARTCSRKAPCTQEKCCQNHEHHAKGQCSKEAPCTQNEHCQNAEHHAKGLCSKEFPCTQAQKIINCKDADHHTAGICSKEAPCTQNCQNQSHLRSGSCSRNLPCCQRTTGSQSTNQSKYCASVEEEEANQTTTSSTISMSPRLGPSEPDLPAPNPHVAVFEHLVYGFKQTSQARINASGGARGFSDRMTELFVKMAEDALPAIRQRVDDNAQC